jgi:MaoC dehydratase-like protein
VGIDITITEEALAELRGRVGMIIEDRPQPHVEEATRDTIRHFAWGMGDDNPLWSEGGLAPPCFLYATDRVVSGYVGGLPGVHALFAGTDWRWHQPIRLGDRIDAKARLVTADLKESKFSGRAVKQVYRVEFVNQRGELLAEADSWCFRTERATARDRGKYADIRPTETRYSAEDIEQIAKAYRTYERQGSRERRWREVEVGDPLPLLPKGPLTVTGMIAWDQGWGGLYIRADALAFQLFDAHPALAIANAQGVPDVPERVHWEDELARAIGAPGAYDYGPERIAWLSQLMTDFIGDAGFLVRLNAQVRRFNVVGDTTWCSGEVTGKSVDGDRHLIECRLWAENQRGETTAMGTAMASLPS